MHSDDSDSSLPPEPEVAPGRTADAIEPLLGYLAVVARHLTAGKPASLDGASDLVQLTIVAALDTLAKGRGPGAAESELKAWLRAIMLNVRRQAWRRRAPHSGLACDQIADDTSTPSCKASRQELVSRMCQARTRLGDRDRQILDLRHLDQLTFEAIGDTLGISAPAAHKAHQRALDRLEDAFLEIAATTAYRETRARLRSVHRGPDTT